MNEELENKYSKEVYVVCGEEEEDFSDIFIAESWNALDLYLKTLTPDVDSYTRVFHGIITPAKYLPKSFHGKSVFMVCFNPEDMQQGAVIETTDETPEELADTIETYFEQGIGGENEGTPDIDNINILYGYQLQTCISVDSAEEDEESIETCEIIGREVNNTARVVNNVKKGDNK